MVVSVGDYLVMTDGVKIIGIKANNFSNQWELKLDFSTSEAYTY